MAKGDKSKYTKKQKRQAEHIEKGYEKRGVSEKEAESRAWATVNKLSGGGKKSGSGRKKTATRSRTRKKAATSSRKTNSARKSTGTRKRTKNTSG
jgi:plasmid stabilization system protein ParE